MGGLNLWIRVFWAVRIIVTNIKHFNYNYRNILAYSMIGTSYS